MAIQENQAKATEFIEGLVGSLSTAEAKAETGEIKQEEYTKVVESAVQKTEETVRSFPESPAVLLSASRVMSQAGHYDQAIAYADHAAALAPQDPWPVVNKGIAQFEKCDFPSANGTAREALKRDPGNQNAIALWNLSQRPAGCNDVTDRLQSRFLGGKMRELALPGRTPSLDFLRGAGLDGADGAAGGREAVAGADAPNRYTRESFMRFKAMMSAAGNALASADNERAFGLVTTAILAAPQNENPGALFLRAIAGLNLKQHEGVITDAGWGAKLDPKNKTKWLALRASAENAIGRYSVALADAREAARLDPGNAGAWSALGRAMQGLNHPAQEWLGAYKRASELDAKFTPAYAQALAAANGQGQDARRLAPQPGGVKLPEDWRLLLTVAAGLGLLMIGAVAIFRRRKGEDSA